MPISRASWTMRSLGIPVIREAHAGVLGEGAAEGVGVAFDGVSAPVPHHDLVGGGFEPGTAQAWSGDTAIRSRTESFVMFQTMLSVASESGPS